MKEMDEKATALLLAALDSEIELKCMELKEGNRQKKLKKIFFSSCGIILLLFILQSFINIFNVNYLIIIILYQAIALVMIVPVITKMYKGEIIKWKG